MNTDYASFPKYRQNWVMKTNMFLLFLLLSVPSFLLPMEKDYSLKVKTTSEKSMEVTFELKNYKVTATTIDGSEYSKLNMVGALLSDEIGKPALPFVTILLGLPVSGGFEVTIRNIETETKNIPFVEPVQTIPLGHTKSNNFMMDKCYGKDSYYPEVIYAYKEVGFLRDHRIGSVLFYPFRYNPKKRSLVVIKRAILTIDFHKGKDEKGIIRIPKRNNPYEMLFSKLVINYEKSKLWLKPHKLPKVTKLRQRDEVYKIVTTNDGIYQINYNDLINAGIDPKAVIPQTIHISNKGYEIPIFVKGEADSLFNTDDYIDFFAERIGGEQTYFNLYTDKNIYWLSFGDSLGKRMVEEDGTPSDTIDPIIPESFRDRLHFESDSIFARLSESTVDTTDSWFWHKLYAPDTQQVNISIPSPDTLTYFELSIMLHGLTTTANQHKVQVLFNTSYLGEFTWWGQSPYNINIGNISGALLQNGRNTITFIMSSPIDSIDGLFLNWFEVSYNHLLYTDDNTITFKTPYEIVDTTYEYRLNNYDFADVSIYKRNVSRIINFKKEIYQEAGNTKYRFIFQDRDLTEGMQFFVVPIWEKQKPLSIEKVEPRDLHTATNRAECLIITDKSLRNSAENYGIWKEAHGFSCMVVTTDEIYNEFNYGIPSPDAIREFIKYAYDFYTEPPLYCLLFGDGTYDYRGLKGYQGNMVPVHLSWYWGLWGPVADDEYYARVSGDDYLPDIFIGRFPIRTDYEFLGLFEKTKIYADYQNLDEWKRDLVFVADSGTAGYNSYNSMETIIKDYLPLTFDPSRCYHPRKNREDFLKEMNEGTVFVNFLSHGGGDILCGGDFLVSKDIYRMTNLDRMPFWTAFSCVNGFFDEPHPDSISIGETVFLAPNGGGIGYYGPGSLTYGGYNYLLSKSIYEGIFNKNLLYFGQFLAYGEITYYSSSNNKYPLLTYNLLGDPSIELTLPDTVSIDISLFPPSLSAGDTLNIQGFVHGSYDGEAVITLYSTIDTAFKKITSSVNSGNFTISSLISDTLQPGKGTVKVYFRGNGIDGVGYERFNIEQPNISCVRLVPEKPTKKDSVLVKAVIFDPDGLIQTALKWKNKEGTNWQEIIMIPYMDDTFITSSAIPAQLPNTTVEFKLYATDSSGNIDTSRIYTYHITALAELSFVNKNIYLDGDSIVEIKVDIQNSGETRADSFRIGFFTMDSENNSSIDKGTKKVIRRMGPDTIGYDTLGLKIDSIGTATTGFHLPFDKYGVYAVIDPDNWVEEGNETNNSSSDNPTYLWVDHFPVTPDSGTGGMVQSFDSVLYCTIPPNRVSSKTVLVIEPDSIKKPLLEPDISPVPIDGDTTKAYNISLTKDVLIDSFLLSFTLKDSISFYPYLYLYLDDYNKWATVGKTLKDSSSYRKATKRTGSYALFYNGDSIPPKITSRIENTDYINSTIYEKKLRASAVLTDRNGIDVVTKAITLTLNGDTVESNNYTYSKNPQDIRALPLKYSDNLEDGSYTLIVSAYDVNGNQGFDTLSFDVSIPFDIYGIGNYPNPVYLDSTIFAYHLSRSGEEVTLKIFTAGGRLIKEFTRYNVSEGYNEITWKLNDQKNRPLANGVYFYRFKAKRGGKEKTKTLKMAILR